MFVCVPRCRYACVAPHLTAFSIFPTIINLLKTIGSASDHNKQAQRVKKKNKTNNNNEVLLNLQNSRGRPPRVRLLERPQAYKRRQEHSKYETCGYRMWLSCIQYSKNTRQMVRPQRLGVFFARHKTTKPTLLLCCKAFFKVFPLTMQLLL